MKIATESSDRIERALDGLLPADELAALHAEVVRDPALRAAYAERAWLHGALHAERERLQVLLPPEKASPRAAHWVWFFGFTAVAAAAVVVAGLFFWRHPAPSPTVATLVQADNTKWSGSTLLTLSQSRLGPGMLALAEGIATVRFESGAVITLEAPTKFEIVDPLRCRLLEGSLTAEVPPAAHGFTVETPDLRVVDLGTRFGVTASSTGNSHVFVFEGAVRLDDAGPATGRRLTAGSSYHVASGITTRSGEPSRAEPVQMIDSWTSIPTSFGRGRDGFARRGYVAAGGKQPLLFVKHTELEPSRRNERRAILTFDLGELGAAPITEAQLVLDPEPSGYGFAAMVPDSRFAIYGVQPGLADGWSEHELTWENFPACDDAGIVAGAAEKIAEFWLPRGASGEPFAIRGDALAAFVGASRGGLVTFLIVRETGETNHTGLVHAFASKEHPTARPPTLRVR